MLIYKAYLLTGLRKSELASLTVGQLELDEPLPFAVLDARAEKNRRGTDIPLREDLADEMQQWLNDRLANMQTEARAKGSEIPNKLPSDFQVFNVPSGFLRILNRDLKLSDIPKKDDRGRTVDIIALRYTFGTHLSKGGVAPRTAQAAMRHSNIDLTMNVYTDPRLLDVHGALDALPPLLIDAATDRSPHQAKATGTDNATARPFAPEFAPKTGKGSKSWSIVGNSEDLPSGTKKDTNPEKQNVSRGLSESGRLDLNQRPLRPERSALPG